MDNAILNQILHIAFGSVLTGRAADRNYRLRDRFFAMLHEHSEVYAGNLEKHFIRHLKPFAEIRD